MLTLLWAVMTYGVLGGGILLTSCVLSGFATLENFGFRVAALGMSIAAKKGAPRDENYGIPLAGVITVVSAGLMTSEYYSLIGIRKAKEEGLVLPSELSASLVRHQRNWWICLLGSLIWLCLWRLSALVTRKRAIYKELKAKANVVARS